MSDINLRLRPRHAHVFLCSKRFIVLVAGRRWGKTRLSLTRLFCTAAAAEERRCYYIAPTYRQAKQIAWEPLKQMIPPDARCRIREQELSIELCNGSMIQLHGADRPDSLRVLGWISSSWTNTPI